MKKTWMLGIIIGGMIFTPLSQINPNKQVDTSLNESIASPKVKTNSNWSTKTNNDQLEMQLNFFVEDWGIAQDNSSYYYTDFDSSANRTTISYYDGFKNSLDYFDYNVTKDSKNEFVLTLTSTIDNNSEAENISLQAGKLYEGIRISLYDDDNNYLGLYNLDDFIGGQTSFTDNGWVISEDQSYASTEIQVTNWGVYDNLKSYSIEDVTSTTLVYGEEENSFDYDISTLDGSSDKYLLQVNNLTQETKYDDIHGSLTMEYKSSIFGTDKTIDFNYGFDDLETSTYIIPETGLNAAGIMFITVGILILLNIFIIFGYYFIKFTSKFNKINRIKDPNLKEFSGKIPAVINAASIKKLLNDLSSKNKNNTQDKIKENAHTDPKDDSKNVDSTDKTTTTSSTKTETNSSTDSKNVHSTDKTTTSSTKTETNSSTDPKDDSKNVDSTDKTTTSSTKTETNSSTDPKDDSKNVDSTDKTTTSSTKTESNSSFQKNNKDSKITDKKTDNSKNNSSKTK